MTEQERNVLLNELRQQESQREKQIKRERFRRLNPYAKKGAVVFAGSSLMEQFPLYEFLQDDDLHCTLYNRGIGGFTTTELLEAMDECILELQPAHLFLNIGTNDLNGPDYDRAAMLGRYEEIVQQIRKKLPETKLYLLAYYPVNPTVAEDPGLIECFRWRTNERIREASEGVQALARKPSCRLFVMRRSCCAAALWWAKWPRCAVRLPACCAQASRWCPWLCSITLPKPGRRHRVACRCGPYPICQAPSRGAR